MLYSLLAEVNAIQKVGSLHRSVVGKFLSLFNSELCGNVVVVDDEGAISDKNSKFSISILFISINGF